MKERIVWIDWAKAILIYLMVVGHCFPVAWENQLIYAFHMPAFFIISGYLYHPHKWWKTLRSFLIPILFFSSVNFLIYTLPKLLKGSFSTVHLAERMLVPFWGPGSLQEDEYIYLFPGVWFIFALLFCRLFMGDLSWFSWVRKYKYCVLVSLLVLLVVEPFLFPDNPLRPYKFYRFIPSFPFVLFGYCLKNRMDLSRMSFPLVIVLMLLFVIISFWNGYTNILNYKFGHSYIVFWANACIASIVLYRLCYVLKDNSSVRFISTGTMLILALNINLKIFFNLLFARMGLGTIVTDHYIYPWILGLLIVIVCFWPIKWLLKYCPILLGKN